MDAEISEKLYCSHDLFSDIFMFSNVDNSGTSLEVSTCENYV